MDKRNYKYTLLEDQSVTESNVLNSDPWKILVFSVLAIIIFMYYANSYSKDFNKQIYSDTEVENLSNLTSAAYATSTLSELHDVSSLPTTFAFSEQPILNITNIFINSTTVSTTPITKRSTPSSVEIAKTSEIKELLEPQTSATKRTTPPSVKVAKTSEIKELLEPQTSATKRTTPSSVKVAKTSEIKKLLKPQKFYVETDQCHMPWVDPFGKEAKKIFKPQKYKKCSTDKALISKFYNETQRRYILSINYEKLEDLSCCYQQVIRSGSGGNADNKFKLLPCAVFHQNFTVPQHIDSMIIECKSIKTNKSIQKDAFSFIQERSTNSKVNTSSDRNNKPSILLIGIDSLSRFNFRRNMPKTAKYLMQDNWFELEGYNKIGDNTFPNLMALLSGFNESFAYSKCKPKSSSGELDKCNFIWTDSKAKGYETAYAEDETWMSSFNYLKKGFKKQPTDFYLRPFMLAVGKSLKIQNRWGTTYCIGRRHSAEYIYDFGLEFAIRHRNTPGFGLFWTNTFSHNSYDASSSMDGKMLEYLENLKKERVFETSIVVFFSDHGMRWGALTNLPEGFLEERLPMMFISLPKWFSDSYPEHVKALKTNRNRLTTPYDIHQTLKHILSLSQTNYTAIEPAFSCPNAQSIFYEMPKNRTCTDACIPEHWCTCSPYEVLSTTNSEVKHVTDLVIDEINNYLTANNFSSLCTPLRRSSIKEALIKMDTHGVISRIETLRIKFKVEPKSAYFQATALYDQDSNKVKIVIENVSRLNTYSKDSQCIDNNLAKKFCICRK